MTHDTKGAAFRHLAIDLGAGSCRVALGNIHKGRLHFEIAHRFQTPLQRDPSGRYQCWNIDGILEEIQNAIRASAQQMPIASVGIDSWAVDYVLLDQNLRQVGSAVAYRDRRTAGIMERLCARMPRSEIYRRTGIQFQPFNTLYQLAATRHQEPQWIEQAQHLLMIPDYLHFQLSGALSNEYTNATTTQMCGLDGRWDPELLELAGLRHNIMQQPTAPGTVLGETSADCGSLKAITPATHDTASAVAGTPIEGEHEAYISSGTWSLMGIESTSPIATEDARNKNFSNEGGFGGRFRVLKNIMGMWPIQRICEEHRIEDLAMLVDQASVLPAWRVLINPDDPVFLNPPSMIEAIRSYCRQTTQPVPESVPEIARCIFDSLALAYRSVKEDLELLAGRKLRRIRIMGGGSQNCFLNQLCADACELPVVAGPVEASVLGNLSVQMIALGIIEDLQTARNLIRLSFPMQEFFPSASVPDHAVQRFSHLLRTPYRKEEV